MFEPFLLFLFGLQISGVLGNDELPTGVPVIAVVDVQPAVGTLTFANDGNFTFTPPAAFVGDVTFTYHLESRNNYVSPPATVTIAVQKRPVAIDDSYQMWSGDTLVTGALVARDDAYETLEDTQLVVPAPGVLGNDGQPNAGKNVP